MKFYEKYSNVTQYGSTWMNTIKKTMKSNEIAMNSWNICFPLDRALFQTTMRPGGTSININENQQALLNSVENAINSLNMWFPQDQVLSPQNIRSSGTSMDINENQCARMRQCVRGCGHLLFRLLQFHLWTSFSCVLVTVGSGSSCGPVLSNSGCDRFQLGNSRWD